MAKIPVGATIAQAYRFAFGGFLNILSVVWLSWLIIWALGFLLRAQTLAFSTAMATRNFAGMSQLLAALIPFYLVALFLLFMQITGITQQALGLRHGSRYYYLRFDQPVWRLIGASLLAILIIVGSYLLLIAAGALLEMSVALLARAMHWSRAVPAVSLVVMATLAFGAYIYSLVRATFFLNPVVVAEGRISLKRSWALASGNFWRIVIIMLAVLVPVLAIHTLLLFSFLMHGLPPAPPLHPTADQLAANRAMAAAWNAEMLKRIRDYWYLVYPAYAVIAALFYGLICGAQCFAYRALTQEQA
jgi:hypothetical protein